MSKNRLLVGELRGWVIHGECIGATLGYPTANLSRHYFRHHPVPKGVYAAMTKLGTKKLFSAVVVGVDGKLEVHIINWSGNLYGKYLTVELIKKIRALDVYKNDSLLKKQIARDLVVVKKILRTCDSK